MVIKSKFNTINFEWKKNEIMRNLIEMNRFEQVAKFNKDISKKKPFFLWKTLFFKKLFGIDFSCLWVHMKTI